EKKSHSRTILFVVLFVLIAGGLGAAGYFLYPVFFPASVAPVTTPSATVTPPPATTSPVAILKHNSYITSDGATTPVLSLAQAKDAAPTMASGTKPVLKEIILQDASGSQPNFSKYFSSLVNVFSESDLRAIFDDDFTTFIYYSEQGSWPGYVAKLKDGASLAVAQNIIRSKMESFPLIANLFLSNPGGSLAAGYKDGNLNGRPSRYLSFSEKDAAINYAFIGNYFLISTNYAAATEAAKRLIMSSSTSAVNNPNF
ncbi:MAG: hypothetical protein Q8P97_01425, partial [bacterium]|nr:hypothetical protein [bacterium]